MNELAVREDLPRSRLRPKWRKRFLLGSLVAVPLGLAIPFVYFIFSSNQELQEAFAETDRIDPGWRMLELEQKRAVVPDEENSGLVLIAAKKVMPANWPFWDNPQAPENRERSAEEMRTLQKSLSDLAPTVQSDLEPRVQLDKRQTDALREELQRADKALAATRKVADLPRGRYPIAYTRDYVSTLLAHTADSRSMGSVLAYDALLRAQDEDMDGALTSCRAILNCGRSIGDEPTLISMLIRSALDGIAVKRLERIIAQGQPSEKMLSVIQHEFEEEAAQPLLLIGARGERGLIDGLMQAIQDRAFDPGNAYALTEGNVRRSEVIQLLRIPAMAKGIRAALLKYNNRFVEIAKLPVEQQVGRIKEWQAAEQDLPEFARLFVMTPVKCTVAIIPKTAELRCAAVMVAVERYRRANNRWPDALADLVPGYLSKVPLDPFDAKPLRYLRLDGGVIVYSIGPDGIDNGGKLHRDPAKEGTDLGFRLWDVAQRRQPPKPKDKDDSSAR